MLKASRCSSSLLPRSEPVASNHRVCSVYSGDMPPAPQTIRRSQRLLAYAAIYGFWGGSFLAIRDIVAVTPPFFSAALRFVLAGLVLYAWARLRGSRRLIAREWRHSALMGLVMFGGNYSCLFWAEQRINSGLAAVLTAMVPVWIFLGEWLFFGTQRLTIATFGGILLGISGVVMLSRASVTGAGPHGDMAIAAGVLLLGTLLFSVASLWSRKLTLPHDQALRAGVQMLLGGGVLFLASALAGELPYLPAAAHAWQWHTLGSFLYLVIAASILAFTAYTWLLHHDSATRVSSYAYVNPVVALAIGSLFAGERMTGAQWAGTVLVLFGVFATLMGKQPAVATLPGEPGVELASD